MITFVTVIHVITCILLVITIAINIVARVFVGRASSRLGGL